MLLDLLDGTTLRVRGVPDADRERLLSDAPTEEAWRRILPVFVGDVGDVGDVAGADRLPMLGTYRIQAGEIHFSPRYPLIPGQRYTAVFEAGSRRAVASLDVPGPERPPARVVEIYPSGDVLPENLLRFYLCFSAPMREGEALRHVHLLEGDGREREREEPGVFVDTRVELWDRSMTRLALLLHPARVKTGLVAHEALGRALVPGLRYRLLIDERFRDARGAPLGSSREKRFTVARALASPPDVRRWELDAPKALTRDPLTVRFPSPLDFVLLSVFMGVRRLEGAPIQGASAVGRGETSWQFVPEDPWERGGHALSVDARLEDVAGNNLSGLLDRPGQTARPSPVGETISLPFQIQ